MTTVPPELRRSCSCRRLRQQSFPVLQRCISFVSIDRLGNNIAERCTGSLVICDSFAHIAGNSQCNKPGSIGHHTASCDPYSLVHWPASGVLPAARPEQNSEPWSVGQRNLWMVGQQRHSCWIRGVRLRHGRSLRMPRIRSCGRGNRVLKKFRFGHRV